MKFMALLLIALAFNAFARPGYVVRGAGMQKNGELCITEVGKTFVGSLGYCSSDKVDAAEAKRINDTIDAFFADKPMSLLDAFLDEVRKKGSEGGFTIADFQAYLNDLKSNPTCKSTLKIYAQRKRELERKLQRINESLESEEKNLVKSCRSDVKPKVDERSRTAN